MEEEPQAEATTPQVSPSPEQSPTQNSDQKQDLGRFRSLEAKQRSLSNLKPPRRPGDPPLNPSNLGGRPKKDGIFTSVARRFAKKKFPGDAADRTYGELVVESMFKQAIKGNVFAASLLFERLDGRVPMPELTDLPVNIVVQVNRNTPRYPQIELPKKETLVLEADTNADTQA